MLRRMFEPKREEVVVGWRRPHTKELHKFYVSQNTIRMIKLRRFRWGTCSAYGRRKIHTKLLLENLKGRDHSEDLNVDGRIISEWILRI
jgi:hypothetical protein